MLQGVARGVDHAFEDGEDASLGEGRTPLASSSIRAEVDLDQRCRSPKRLESAPRDADAAGEFQRPESIEGVDARQEPGDVVVAQPPRQAVVFDVTEIESRPPRPVA